MAGTDFYRQSFYGWLKNQALRGNRDAKRIAGYGGPGTITKAALLEKISAARTAGRIDAEWQKELLETMARVWERYQAGTHLVDARDPKEWEQVGDGHRRRQHLPEDMAEYDRAQRVVEGTAGMVRLSGEA